MQINPEIFKAYDIRGVYNKDFDDKIAYKIGLAFATIRRNELKKEKIKIIAAADMRLSSPSLKKELIKGLTDGGADVDDIGLSSTPTFYFAVAHYKYDGGIIISASHNPKEYNGFKIVRDRALPVSKDSGMFDLRDMVIENKMTPVKDAGIVTERYYALENQVERSLGQAHIDDIKPFRIVIDPANGMGAQYFDELFKHLPCEIIKMNWELDGTFPSHEADPLKPENMEDLKNKIIEEKADLGIATDGDGDRIFFADELGNPIEPGITRAILCKLFLLENPGAKIAYDIRPGRITRDTIIENGGTPIVTRVGHSLIKEQAIREGAVFAGESSGHFFLNMEEGCYEIPLIITLKLLEELSVQGLKFSEYIKPYKKYFHSGEINSRVDDVNKKIEEIKNIYKDGDVSELDGITVEYSDYWFNVRPSNTEPLLRLNLEARTEELMKEKRDEIINIIKR